MNGKKREPHCEFCWISPRPARLFGPLIYTRSIIQQSPCRIIKMQSYQCVSNLPLKRTTKSVKGLDTFQPVLILKTAPIRPKAHIYSIKNNGIVAIRRKNGSVKIIDKRHHAIKTPHRGGADVLPARGCGTIIYSANGYSANGCSLLNNRCGSFNAVKQYVKGAGKRFRPLPISR